MSNEHNKQSGTYFRNKPNLLYTAQTDSSNLNKQFHSWKKLTQEFDKDFQYVTQQKELLAKDAILQSAMAQDHQSLKYAQNIENKKKELLRIGEEKSQIAVQLENKQKQLKDITDRIMSEIKANELGLNKITVQDSEPHKWIKHKEECINALQGILQQTINTLMHARAERDIIHNTIYESSSEDIQIFNKAISQLQESNQQITEQRNKFEQGISSISAIISQSNEERNMTLEDLSSHLIQRAEKVVVQEELDDLLETIKRKNKCEDYDVFVSLNDDSSRLQQEQYIKAKEKAFAIEILKHAPRSENVKKLYHKIIGSDCSNPIQEIESTLNIKIETHFQEYSKKKDECNKNKKERKDQIETQLKAVSDGLKNNVNIVDSLILPQLKAYEETIANCVQKKQEMETQCSSLNEAGEEVVHQLEDLENRKNDAITHSTKRIDAENDLAKLDNKISEIEEEERIKRKEIMEITQTISKTQKEKETSSKRNEAEQNKINSIIMKLQSQLTKTKETLGKDIKQLSLSLQQKEIAIQALQEGLKNTNSQYSNAMGAYDVQLNTLNARDMNMPIRLDRPMSMAKTSSYQNAHSRAITNDFVDKSMTVKINQTLKKSEAIKEMNEKDFQSKLSNKSRAKRNYSLSRSSKGNAKSNSNYSYFTSVNGSTKKA